MDGRLGIGLLVFAGCATGLWSISVWGLRRYQVMRWRTLVIGRSDRRAIQDLFVDWLSRGARLLERVGKRLDQKAGDELTHLPNRFTTAGYRHPRIPFLLHGAKLAGLLGFPCLWGSLGVLAFHAVDPAAVWIGGIGMAVCGWYAPDLWLRRLADHRRRTIERGFPDALDLMVVCVEAGLALDPALRRVGTELRVGHRGLSEELSLLSVELQAGRARGDAMRRFGLRTDLDEVKNFVALLVQTERFGTGLAQSLRVHSEAIRRRHQLRAEELASQLPVKMLLPLVFFVLPLLFIILVGPILLRGMQSMLPGVAG
ncbi:MAG: type II secretion system F family protein [Nitrospirota bacterium]